MEEKEKEIYLSIFLVKIRLNKAKVNDNLDLFHHFDNHL